MTTHTTKPWIMPQWMEPFRQFICNTGGNSVEELMNNHDANIVVNAPLAMLCVAVKSQVIMLGRINDAGKVVPNA